MPPRKKTSSKIKFGPTRIVSSTLPIVNGKIVGRTAADYAAINATEKKRKLLRIKQPRVKGAASWYPRNEPSNGIGVGP